MLENNMFSARNAGKMDSENNPVVAWTGLESRVVLQCLEYLLLPTGLSCKNPLALCYNILVQTMQLKSIGNKNNCTKTIANLLGKLMTPEVLKKFTRDGKNAKRPFVRTQLYSCMKGEQTFRYPIFKISICFFKISNPLGGEEPKIMIFYRSNIGSQK